MRELKSRQEMRMAEQGAAIERGPNYGAVLTESLPPIDELIREYNAMVRERLKAQQSAELHFADTMYRWSLRERGEA